MAEWDPSNNDINRDQRSASSYVHTFPYRHWEHTQEVSALSPQINEKNRLSRNIERRLMLPLQEGQWERAFEVLRSSGTKKGIKPDHYVQLVKMLLRTTTSHMVLFDHIRDELFGGELEASPKLYRVLTQAYVKRKKLVDAVECVNEGIKRLGAVEQARRVEKGGQTRRRGRGVRTPSAALSSRSSVGGDQSIGGIDLLGSRPETNPLCKEILELAANTTQDEVDEGSLSSIGAYTTPNGEATSYQIAEEVLQKYCSKSMASQPDIQMLLARAAARSGSWKEALEIHPSTVPSDSVVNGRQSNFFDGDATALALVAQGAIQEGGQVELGKKCRELLLENGTSTTGELFSGAAQSRASLLLQQVEGDLISALSQKGRWEEALDVVMTTTRQEERRTERETTSEEKTGNATTTTTTTFPHSSWLRSPTAVDYLLTGMYNGGASDDSIYQVFETIQKAAASPGRGADNHHHVLDKDDEFELSPRKPAPSSLAYLFPGRKRKMEEELSDSGHDYGIKGIAASSASDDDPSLTTSTATTGWVDTLQPCGASIVATAMLGLGQWRQALAVTKACGRLSSVGSRGTGGVGHSVSRWLEKNIAAGRGAPSMDDLPVLNKVDSRFLRICATLQHPSSGYSRECVDEAKRVLGPLQIYIAEGEQQDSSSFLGGKSVSSYHSTPGGTTTTSPTVSSFFNSLRKNTELPAPSFASSSEAGLMSLASNKWAPTSLRPSRHHYFGTKFGASSSQDSGREYMKAQTYARAQHRFGRLPASRGSVNGGKLKHLQAKISPFDSPLKAPGGVNDMSSGWAHYGVSPKKITFDDRRVVNPLSDIVKRAPIMSNGSISNVSWADSTPARPGFMKNTKAAYVDPGTLPDNNLM